MEFKRFEALIEMFPQVQIFSTEGEDLDRVITHFLNQRENVSTMSEAMQRKIQQALAPFFQQRFISLHDAEAPLVRNLLLDKKFLLQTDRYIDDMAWPLTDPEKLGEALNIADLAEGILDRKLLSLSNGELRRVLLARMWMEKPEWVYFNDLFGGLDPEYRAHLAGCVADLAKRPGLKVVVRLAREDELLPEIPAFVFADKTFTQYVGELPKAAATPKFKKAELKDYDIVYLYLANRSPEKSWKNVIAEYDLTAPNCVHYNLPDDQQHAVEQYVGLTGYPTYRLFDKQGGIHHLNWLDDENLSEFKKKLDALNE